MNKKLTMIVAGTLLAAACAPAMARDRVSFSLAVGAPVVVAPAPVYYAPPAYYVPPVSYYSPPPVLYYPSAPVATVGFVGYRGWHHHRHW